ncbi:hypothetical protein M3G15_08575 [Paenibacillus sp. p3-SID1389]|uniref:hypothetical protein n=1 Tax=Paenibacillus sp. p3-SID1389 TaxID=2916364 RepID=UPI0021A6AAED|nr:hypothetical protein [Paenibacillus sp. p3-SID1389]MCT2195194.1 hypothetical protein [Paenibacillus sp. p3-SID1389]
MTTKAKRDLAADLALCEAATPGPWRSKTNRHPELGGSPWGWYEAGGRQIGTWSGSRNRNYSEDNRFIEVAREGWPHAIRRAIAAETEVIRLIKALDKVRKCLINNAHISAEIVVDRALLGVSDDATETSE